MGFNAALLVIVAIDALQSGVRWALCQHVIVVA